MKGNVKVIVEIKDESREFDDVRKITMERNFTFEHINDWLYIFQGILASEGYDSDLIKEHVKTSDNY